MTITEDIVELAAIETLQELGWRYLHGSVIAPDGSAPERRSFGDVILIGRLEAAIARINPDAPEAARAEAMRRVLTGELPSLVEENRRIHKLLTEGVDVEYRADSGKTAATKIWLIDLERADANDWLAVNQFVVVQNRANRRPDLVLFVNGLPLAVLELKNAAAQNATIADAYNQLQTYLHQIPGLFSTNAVLVTSDGMEARIGSITANAERFMPWRTVDGEDFAHRGTPELETLPRERLICLGGAIDWVLKWQESQAARQKTDEEKKRAHRRFLDMVLELSKAYALASASDEARAIRDEVGFFQAIRAALAKTTATGKISEKDRAFAVQQLVDRAVASSEIIDILKVAGLQSPDISILSDEFLMEVGKMEKKNLALEALKKLLNGEIVSRSKTNLVESKALAMM